MSIEFGYASSIITPELPANLAGYFNIRMWKLVADDLYVKVAVFRQDGRLGAIVQYDVITASTELCEIGSGGWVLALQHHNLRHTHSYGAGGSSGRQAG